MSIYVAFLRGINVSGQKIIKMADLKKHIEKIGYANVQTYIQSGNILFEAKKRRVQLFEQEIQDTIKKEYSFDVVVMVKTADEMDKIISGNPFGSNIDQKKLYVTMLSGKPNASDLQGLQEHKNKADKFIVKDDIVYIVYDEGAGKSDFSNNFIEKKLKLSATSRNWNTMNTLLELLQAKKS